MLSLLLMVCMFGCATKAQTPAAPSSDDSELTAEERFQKGSAFIESLIDVSKAEVQTDEEDPGYLQRYWQFGGPADAANIPETVTIDGKDIAIGQITVKQVKELGFTVDFDMDTVEPDTILSFSIVDGTKALLLTTAANTADQSIPFDDAVIAGFSGSFSAYSMPFDYAGITEASTLKDIIAAFGLEAGEAVIGLVASTSDAEITVRISNTVQNGDTETIKSLDIYFLYSALENTAAINGFLLNINVYPADAD